MKKKSKKGKKRKNIAIKKARVIISLLIILAIIVFIFMIIDNSPKLTKAMSVLDKYMSCLNESKYDEMYEMISESTKKNISKEDFIARNEEIYGQIEANHITVSNMTEEIQDNRKNKSYIYKQNGNGCRNTNICKYCKAC